METNRPDVLVRHFDAMRERGLKAGTIDQRRHVLRRLRSDLTSGTNDPEVEELTDTEDARGRHAPNADPWRPGRVD